MEKNQINISKERTGVTPSNFHQILSTWVRKWTHGSKAADDDASKISKRWHILAMFLKILGLITWNFQQIVYEWEILGISEGCLGAN